MSAPSLSEYAVALGNGTSTREYHFNLIGAIGEARNYTDLLNTLRSAEEGDEIYIHINSPGGQVATAVQIINGIKSSRATVFGVIEAECASAATVIFLACDAWTVMDNTISLFHQYTSGSYGEGHKQKAQVAAVDRWITELNNDYYSNFLTKKELAKMMEGKDIWLTSEDMRARLEKLVEAKQAEQDALEEEQNKETLKQAKLIIKALESEDDKGNS